MNMEVTKNDISILIGTCNATEMTTILRERMILKVFSGKKIPF